MAAKRRADGRPTVRILGTHGVPAAYGGFETAAENVALYLRDHGWRVIVYCQEPGTGPIREDVWNGIERVNIPIDREGWLGTSQFDSISIRHADQAPRRLPDVRLQHRRLQHRCSGSGGSPTSSTWTASSGRGRAGARCRQASCGRTSASPASSATTSSRIIPAIEEYLRTRARASARSRRSPTAPTPCTARPTEPVDGSSGSSPADTSRLICRPIPENSILELVTGFSARAARRTSSPSSATTTPTTTRTTAPCCDAASDEVRFLGADLRPGRRSPRCASTSLAYLHGHTVGGTNPSLVEAMAAGNPVIAHDNEYNRWVAGDGAVYFTHRRRTPTTASTRAARRRRPSRRDGRGEPGAARRGVHLGARRRSVRGPAAPVPMPRPHPAACACNEIAVPPRQSRLPEENER